MPFGVTVFDPSGRPQGTGLNSGLMAPAAPQQSANQPFAALDDSTYEGSLAASSASQPPGVSIPRQNPNVLGQGGAFNPTYLDFGGYNPLQYATDGMTSALAQYMGAGTAQTNVAGPVAPPPQNLLAFGNGSNGTGGALLNAGLVGNELEKLLSESNDPNSALQVFNQRRAAELAMAGTGFNPVTTSPVYNPAPSSQAQGPGGSFTQGPDGPTWNPMLPPAGSTGKPAVDDQIFRFQPIDWTPSPTVPNPTTPNTIANLTSPIPTQPASGGLNPGLMGGVGQLPGAPQPPTPPTVTGGRPAGSTSPAASAPLNPSLGGASGLIPGMPTTTTPAASPATSPTIPAPGGTSPSGVAPLNPFLQSPIGAAPRVPGSTPGQPPSSQRPAFDIGQILSLFQNVSQPPANNNFASVDQFMADATNDVGYLRGIAENAGYSTMNGPGMAAALQALNGWSGADGQTPAWMSMFNGPDVQAARDLRDSGGSPVDRTAAWEAAVAASQRNLDRGAADLNERLAVSGNRFSTAFGDAMGDYWNQARLGQNAQLLDAQANALEAAAGRQYGTANNLAQLQQQAGQFMGSQDLQRRMALASLGINAEESARNREMTAAQFLAGQGFNSANQLSAQDFASRQQQQNQAFQAAMQLAGGADSAANLLAQIGATGAQTMNNNSMTGAQNLFNAENQAALQMLQNQMQMLPMLTQYDTALRALGLQGSNQLSQNWMQSLGLGSQLGQQQFGTDAFNLDRIFGEWLRQQPENNPMLPFIAGAATAQPTMYQPQFRPPGISGYLNAAGGIMGGLGALGLSI